MEVYFVMNIRYALVIITDSCLPQIYTALNVVAVKSINNFSCCNICGGLFMLFIFNFGNVVNIILCVMFYK